MSSKYTGYRPYTQRESVLTYAPGQAHDSHTHKYTTTGPAHVPDATEASASVYGRTTSALRKDDFHAPAPSRGVSVLPMEKPCAGASVYKGAYGAFKDEGDALRSIPDAVLQSAFTGVDTDAEGYVTSSEILMVVRRALGVARLSDRQDRVLEGLIARKKAGMFAKWNVEELRMLLDDAADYMDREVHVLRPDVAKASITIASRHREIQEATYRGLMPAGTDAAGASETLLLHGPAPKSSYTVDVGGSGEVPQARPVQDGVAAGLYQTTRDLLAGTTRQSKHVPGYQGHIPSFTGTVAADQGLGQTMRNTFHAKTNLGATYTRRVPGYTGFLPDFDVSDTSEVKKPSGQFAATEALAADHLVTKYWDARKLAGAESSAKKV